MSNNYEIVGEVATEEIAMKFRNMTRIPLMMIEREIVERRQRIKPVLEEAKSLGMNLDLFVD